MMTTVALLPFVAGCDDDNVGPVSVDSSPFPPVGVYSVTRDQLVELNWSPNWEEDLAGYAVYRSDDDGEYFHLADVPADQTWYDDTNVINGQTWFYAVTAFDRANNESDLSYELVFDTPRPEGYNLVLVEKGQNQVPDESGYDFSSLSGAAQEWNATNTDIYFEHVGGVNYARTHAGVDIQDWGLIDMLDVDWAPDSGWLPSGQAELAVGHSYIVRINDGGVNYAKFEVVDVNTTQVTLNWAYQPSRTPLGNPELAPGPIGASR